MSLTNYNSVQLDGDSAKVGTPTVTVLLRDTNGKVLFAYGATVPSDADAGYAKGCLFIKTNGAVATTMYINEGSATSADFNAVESAASGLTGLTVDSIGLLGGGTEGTVSLALGITVKNATGGALTKGTLVRVTGYNGGYLVTKGDADAGLVATHVLTADIADTASGSAHAVALVTNINTDAASAVGDPLYLSGTAGEFTPTAPTGADQAVQRVGVVVTKHATTGSALFFPSLRVIEKRGTSGFQDSAITAAKIASGAVTPVKLAASEALTATADGTGTGAMSGNTSHAVVTSSAATNQISLPASSAALIGKTFTLWVGANGFELITPASSNATINNVDSDGTNQADIGANTLSRVTLVDTNTWILENLSNLGAVNTAIIPDND